MAAPVAATGVAARIAGLSILKGAVLYGATLTFAGFYAYFIEQIFTATNGTPPTFSSAMISSAAALAGVLGSAFALVIGVPTSPSAVNAGLATMMAALEVKPTKPLRDRVLVLIRRGLSLDPPGTEQASWPMTFGIWTYALVATAVAITYVLKQSETPEAIRVLAIAFAGYALALVTAAYGLSKSS